MRTLARLIRALGSKASVLGKEDFPPGFVTGWGENNYLKQRKYFAFDI